MTTGVSHIASNRQHRLSDQVLANTRELIPGLCAIPGDSFLSATAILAEIGRDMSRFPTAGHLISWAGLCPG